MPTGYTSEIYDGKELTGKEFLMKCARAFGACIEMREESLDTPIPEEFKSDTYHKEQIEKAKSELEKYQNMTLEEIQNAIDSEYKKTVECNKNMIKKYKAMKNRYLNTLSEVEIWEPPTPDYINLKNFAITQLKDSIKFDCNSSYYEKEIEKPTPEEWLNNQIDRCKRDIEYHIKEYAEEVKRIEDMNKWIKNLRESLS